MSVHVPVSWRRDLALVFLIVGLFFLIGLGAHPYLAPSEARYIEIPREMVASHDWLTPRINGVPYFEKPPLFYWMQATVLQCFGAGEFAGRIVTALTVTLTCLIAYATGRLLYGRLAGMLAACVLATCALGYGLSRIAMLDAPLTLFLAACLSCFIAAQKTGGKTQRNFYLLMYVAAALAVMTKGLIGIVIPGMVIGLWIALTRSWHVLRQARLIPGLMLFLAIAAPWHILMARQHPGFLNFYFIHEHLERFATEEHKRTAPWWFFIAITLAGLLPWTGLLPAMAKSLRIKEPMTLFLVLWIILPLVFFSCSGSKLPPYIFPVFPALAILLGRHLAALWRGEISHKPLRAATAFIVILFIAAALGWRLLPSLPGKTAQILPSPDALPAIMFLPLGAMLAALALALLRKHSAPVVIMLLAGVGAVQGVTVNYLAAKLDPGTIKPLIQTLLPELQPNDTIVAYGSYWQDLPVYANRTIIVAGWTGELNPGYEMYPETHQWMISTGDFTALCTKASANVYVFMRQPEYDALHLPANCTLRLMGKYGKTVLLKKERP